MTIENLDHLDSTPADALSLREYYYNAVFPLTMMLKETSIVFENGIATVTAEVTEEMSKQLASYYPDLENSYVTTALDWSEFGILKVFMDDQRFIIPATF